VVRWRSDSRREAEKMRVLGRVFDIFLFFSSVVYWWLISLPTPLTWSGVLGFSLILGATAFVIHRRFQSHAGGFKNRLMRLYKSLWTFLMGGITLKVVYPLTMSILPFYQSPGFWIVIAWEASMVGYIYFLRKPEWVFGLGNWVVRRFEQAFYAVQRLR